MRPVTIDPARGFDNTIDPRVGPQGAITRVENMRVDKAGRLVLRNGYTSLGTTVQGNAAAAIRPCDLATIGDELVVLGSHAAPQTGIRGAYRYEPTARGIWRTENQTEVADTVDDFCMFPPAENVRVLISSVRASLTDAMTCDCAVNAAGTVAMLVITDAERSTSEIIAVNTTTGSVVFRQEFPISLSNLRVLAIGAVFYVFGQNGTDIRVGTWDSASTAVAVGGSATIGTGASAFPAAFDVQVVSNGSTDYLLAYPTGTGYTWRRFNSAHVQQTTTNVAALANAPVAICGWLGDNVNVLSIRAVTGFDLRSFNFATGVLTVGPTNLDPITPAKVYDWVSIARIDATTVHTIAIKDDDTTSLEPPYCPVGAWLTATHAASLSYPNNEQWGARPNSKQVFLEGRTFNWTVMGMGTARSHGLYAGNGFQVSGFATGTPGQLAAVCLDGLGKTTNSTNTLWSKSGLALNGRTLYVGLVTFDPRDKTYRANLVACDVFTGRRRQTVASNGQLYIAGGVVAQYDRRIVHEVGFPDAPEINQLIGGTVGTGLTLLGTYTYQVVSRFVDSAGNTTLSAPSAPKTITLTGAQDVCNVEYWLTHTTRTQKLLQGSGTSVYTDVYRTEAGGSIPRLIASIDAVAGFADAWGALDTFIDTVPDATQQSGSALYTQGADGSVSGRLPLALASPGRLLAESDGKLIVAGLERDNQLQLSIEARPGEATGFVNDDLFFVTNPEPITAIVAGEDGRRYLFSEKNIRELIGPGPNAAGVGDISEPVEIESRVGCCDWRSVCKTEHGIFFQSSNTAKPKIYLLPRGASSAIEVSEGVSDLLVAFPIITSATRHDEEQLLTFTLQTADGTDGRILHLDLRTSGMGKNGWTGRWIVDRIAALEGGSFPEIVGEQIDVKQFVIGATIAFDTVRGLRVGDRLLVAVAIQGVVQSITSVPPLTLVGTVSSPGTLGTIALYQSLITTGSLAGILSAAVVANLPTGSAVIIKQWLIRGAHASQAIELTTVSASTTTYTLPVLTPTWGSAKNLWIAMCERDSSFSDPVQPLITGSPAGFSGNTRGGSVSAGLQGDASIDTAFCSRQLEAASITGATFTCGSGVAGTAMLFAIRPLAATGTPVKSSVAFRDRLVVCNALDVVTADPTAVGDLGSTIIVGEWESADIYPQGTAGAGRHLMTSIIGEVLGFCNVFVFFSYDNGLTWTGMKRFRLNPTFFGCSIGQVVKLQWVPKRRKVESVRIRIVMADEDVLPSGATRALALNQVTMWFEDLAGPARVFTSTISGSGSRR